MIDVFNILLVTNLLLVLEVVIIQASFKKSVIQFQVCIAHEEGNLNDGSLYI